MINYSTLARARKGLLLHTTVGIGYETPWRQVEAMLLGSGAPHAGDCGQTAALRAADGARAISPSPTS